MEMGLKANCLALRSDLGITKLGRYINCNVFQMKNSISRDNKRGGTVMILDEKIFIRLFV